MAKIDAIAELKADHVQVRDILLDIIEAANRRNATKALELLLRLDKLGGPHFQWEEESFYPALERFFGPEYKEYLFSVHDRIIRAAKQLAEILGKGEITEEESRKIPAVIRSEVLPHPIECEGLTLFSGKLTKEELEAMAEHFEATRKEGLALLEWADKVRTRKVA
ncbi:MAG: hemerythrin domain-containing protein [Chloroflexi bacterium]|nr:hemerythrin domain-containing protein [Chloroflexota bacterium]